MTTLTLEQMRADLARILLEGTLYIHLGKISKYSENTRIVSKNTVLCFLVSVVKEST